MPGGGGYGDPQDRPLEEIENDVTKGLITLDAALRDYGVVLDATGQLTRG
jgi:N-methylhydantoinase B